MNKRKKGMCGDFDFDDDSDDEVEITIEEEKNLTNKTFHVYFDTEIGSPQKYQKFHKLCRDVKYGDHIELHVNSGGGYIDSMVQIIDSIIKSDAFITSHIYTAASAASVIALCCDEVVVEKFATIMVHSMSSTISGKIGEMETESEYLKKMNNHVYSVIYENFISKDELTMVLKGIDIWMVEYEINERLKNFIPYKRRYLEEALEKKD